MLVSEILQVVQQEHRVEPQSILQVRQILVLEAGVEAVVQVNQAVLVSLSYLSLPLHSPSRQLLQVYRLLHLVQILYGHSPPVVHFHFLIPHIGLVVRQTGTLVRQLIGHTLREGQQVRLFPLQQHQYILTPIAELER